MITSTFRTLSKDLTEAEEFWENFYNKYFSPDVGEYENIGVGTPGAFPVRNIVIAVLAAVVIFTLVNIFQKKVFGVFVDRLLSFGAVGKENAKSLENTENGCNFLIRYALNRGVSLCKVVKSVEKDDYYEKLQREREEYEKRKAENPKLPKFKEIEYKVGKNDRFYIPEDKKYIAETRFSPKGASWLSLAVTVIVCIVMYFVIMGLLPDFFAFLDGIAAGVKQ